MGIAAIFGICNAVNLYHTNLLLFSASVFVTLVTAVGAFLQFMEVDDIQFKWMRMYIAPAALLAVGGLVGYTEVSDTVMIQVGITPPEHIIPGKSGDYSHAAVMQWVAMIYPLFAVALAKSVQLLIDWFKKP